MKLILPVLFTFIFLQITSAQYIPFPEGNAKWSMEIDLWDDPYGPPLNRVQGYLQETIGDTLIDGMLYQKVYQRRTWWTEDYFEELNDGTIIDWFASGNFNDAPTLIGGLRQDIINQKVYFIRFVPNINSIICIQPIDDSALPLNQEVTIFDFDVNVGDTIYLGGNAQRKIIESIDSVLLNDGLYHKVYTPMEFNTPYDAYLEGIGGYGGLFSGVRELFVEGEWCNLNCFAIEDEYIIGETLFGCDSVATIVPVIEIDQETSINISPNPFNEYLWIDFQATKTANLQIRIFNTFGQPVLHQRIDNADRYDLNTTSLAPGIYWLSVYDQKKLVATQRLVKY